MKEVSNHTIAQDFHKKCHCERFLASLGTGSAISVLMMGLPRAKALAMTTLLSSV